MSHAELYESVSCTDSASDGDAQFPGRHVGSVRISVSSVPYGVAGARARNALIDFLLCTGCTCEVPPYGTTGVHRQEVPSDSRIALILTAGGWGNSCVRQDKRSGVEAKNKEEAVMERHTGRTGAVSARWPLFHRRDVPSVPRAPVVSQLLPCPTRKYPRNPHVIRQRPILAWRRWIGPDVRYVYSPTHLPLPPRLPFCVRGLRTRTVSVLEFSCTVVVLGRYCAFRTLD